MDKDQIVAELVKLFKLTDRIREEGRRSYLVEQRQLTENRLRKEVGVEITRH